MKITTLTKDRMILTHKGKSIRIEAKPNGDVNMYVSADTKLLLPRSTTIGKRKIVVKA